MRRWLVVWMLLPPVGAAADDLDDLARRWMAARHVPGLSLAVVRDGRLVTARAYGLANVELQVPATTETVYQIASVTKPFTAGAILLLVERGKVELDAPAGRYLPGLPPAWAAITVRHLLSHTSGLPDYLNGGLVDRQGDYTPARLIEAVFPQPLRFPPGEKWAYSNTNYVLLGRIVEEVSGRRFDEFMAEHIFRPLGMTAARRRDIHALVPGRAAQYDWKGGTLVNARYLSPTVWDNADGGLTASVLDLAKWDAGTAVLAESSVRQMWEAAPLRDGGPAPYGLGWQVRDLRGRRWVGHGGARSGVSAEFVRFPAEKLTVIALANLSDTDLRRGLVEPAAALYEPALEPPSRKTVQHPDPDAAVTRLVRAFLADVARGNRESALVTEGNRRMVSEPQKSAARLLEEMKSLDPLGCAGVGGAAIHRNGAPIERVCSYRLTTAQTAQYLTFYLTADGRVADQEKEDGPAGP